MSFISVMEITGTVAFAVSGALVAIEKDLDYYGILFLAIITAVGGGIMRDVIIDLPLALALENPVYVIISIVSAICVILFYKWVTRLHSLINIFDAVGLAAFTAIGAKAALNNDMYTPFVVITLALLTGTGGGILRDVFVKEIPFVFRKEVYAMASIAGSVAFITAHTFFGLDVTMYICFGVTLVIRLISIKFNWHLAKVNAQGTLEEETAKDKRSGDGTKR